MCRTVMVVAVALGLIARDAHADRAVAQRIAILELVIEGDAPQELRAQLDRSLAGGLYAAGFEVIGRDVVKQKLKAAPELVGCLTTTCLERVGQLVGATRFVRARVEAAGASYDFELELYSAEVTGGLVNRVERSCSVCSIAEANDEMSRAAADIEKQQVALATLDIVTDPPGAAIEVDGSAVGTSPVRVSLAQGEHRVVASLSGRLPAEQRVDVTAEPAEGQQVTLTLAPEPITSPKGKGSRWGAWKWGAAASGVALFVAGVALLAVDGDGTDCPGGGRPCKQLYDTLVGGVLLTGVGIGLGGASVYMFLNDRPREASAEREVGVVARWSW